MTVFCLSFFCRALVGVDRSGRGCNPRPARAMTVFCLSFFAAPLRGWIVPVGDTIPDRRKIGAKSAQESGIIP